MAACFVSPDVIRAMFAAALSAMYKSEVPQYRVLSEIVTRVNTQTLAASPELGQQLNEAGGLDRLCIERHGAIRLGTAGELATLRRLFAIAGMFPVGYYDLSPAGIPVHSTAFRPVDDEALRHNPFRIFTSLLRLDLIGDMETQREARAILSQRRIFTPRCLALMDRAECAGGLDEKEAGELVTEAIETFRWRGEASVSKDLYQKLHRMHPLLADIVCFKGPHINHLTLATLDIDAVQRAMTADPRVSPKAIIEGPPRRHVPILLRQTSFKALAEPVSFTERDGSHVGGAHTARFGEVEQRGAALTAKGRALYDRLLADANASASLSAGGPSPEAHEIELQRRFSEFPDDADALRADGLAFFRYTPTAKGLAQRSAFSSPCSMDELVRAGCVSFRPITYEDFLPVSAAGIFRSNLAEGDSEKSGAGADLNAFEEALGANVLDAFWLYRDAEEKSLVETVKALGLENAIVSRRREPH